MNKFIGKSILLILCLVSLDSQGNGVNLVDSEDVEHKLKELKLEKIQADMIVAQLEESGRLDEREVKAAKREIASVEEDALAELKNQPH